MVKAVIFINGRPRSGKDSCVNFMRSALGRAGVSNAAFSSIDPVKALLKQMGFNTEAKTPKDRNLLAEFGDSLEAYNGYRSSKTVDFVENFFESHESGVVFLHTREPMMIQRISRMLSRISGLRVNTVLVTSPRSENNHTNQADSGVEGMRYDVHIPNEGTLLELGRACRQYLKDYKLIPLV